WRVPLKRVLRVAFRHLLFARRSLFSQRTETRVTCVTLLVTLLGLGGGVYSAKEKTSSMKQTAWDLNTVGNLGGYPTQVLGAPRLMESPQGKAMEFDGQHDGIIVDAN